MMYPIGARLCSPWLCERKQTYVSIPLECQNGDEGDKQQAEKETHVLPFSLSRSLTLSMSGSSQLVQSGVDLTSSSELDSELLG